MKIIVAGKSRYVLKDTHPYALAIMALAEKYSEERRKEAGDEVSKNFDFEHLWRVLSPTHRKLLSVIATHGDISQSDLQTELDLDWQGLRGVHNGLARICERIGYEKPIEVIGYNSMNRYYSMKPEVVQAVKKLAIA